MAQVAFGTGTNQAFKILSRLMCKEVKMPEGYHKGNEPPKKSFSLKEPQVEEAEGEITLEQCYCSKARRAARRAIAGPVHVPICLPFFPEAIIGY